VLKLINLPLQKNIERSFSGPPKTLRRKRYLIKLIKVISFMFEVQKIKLIIVDFFFKIKCIQFIIERMLRIVFLLKKSQLKSIKFILKKLITVHFLIY